MKQLKQLIRLVFAIFSLNAQGNLPPFLTTDYYDQITQSWIDQYIMYENNNEVENLVTIQNRLINHIQNDIDAAIDDTNQTIYALESLQAHSTNLERSLYKTIFYAYYQALYNAMKFHNIADRYFAIISGHEDAIVSYLPEPRVLQ